MHHHWVRICGAPHIDACIDVTVARNNIQLIHPEKETEAAQAA